MVQSDQAEQSLASIIILTYNNLELTRLCIESLYEYTEYIPFEVIVVDNNSQDGTRSHLKETLKAHDNVRIHLNERNEGFARGNNQGAAIALGKFIVFLNNDIVVTKGWLGRLLNHLEDPRIGMVGPVTNVSGNETQIPVDYQTLSEMQNFAAEYTNAHQGSSFEIGMLPFQCVALRSSVFNEIGPLDEEFGLGMFEDDDYALRLKQKSYKILCAEDVFVHHWGSASFSKIGFTEYWQLFKTNLHKFETKWGVEWRPHTQRPELIPQQYRQILENAIQFSDHYVDLEVRVESQRLELDNIYQSNSWRFVQSMLKLRRFLIPENSRREEIFRKLIQPGMPPKTSQDEVIAGVRPPRPSKNHRKEFPGDQRTAPKISFAYPAKGAIKPEGLDVHHPLPLVSVIIPVYNHADMLQAAADSILFGSYPNIELIILDDGSTDEIEPVLKRLGLNPRVRIFRQPNQRLPRALTHAHEFARGEFITWTSADNLFMDDTLARLVNSLLAHPEAIMVYADVSLIDDHGNPLVDRSYRPQNLDPDAPDRLRLHRVARPLSYEADNYINACFLYRREAAFALGGHFAEDLEGLEDYDFWLRLQKAGTFLHIHNQEPLYKYRVHQRTMSHEILAQESVLSEHVERSHRLIEYESQRRAYARKRWHLILDDSLSAEQKAEITACGNSLAVDIETNSVSLAPGTKRMRITTQDIDIDDIVYVRDLAHYWRLEWNFAWDGAHRAQDIWKGIDISPLALKARQHQPQVNHFPSAADRPIVGLHAALRSLPLDLQTTRQLIKSNPGIYFAIVDIPGNDDPELGIGVIEGLENAAYLGSEPYGENYRLYAQWDAVWLPPMTIHEDAQSYRELLALAYVIARPLILPEQIELIAAPFQYIYRPPHESLGFIQGLDQNEIDIPVMDRYLKTWSRAGRFQQLLKLADTSTQEAFISRPDFMLESPPEVKPTFWTPAGFSNNGRMKCALVVNTLDKGGLEKVVAQLASGLPEYGIDSFVICTHSGGETANFLQEKGVRVYTAQDDELLLREILLDEIPDIVSTHLANLSLLKIGYDLGIPIIETIHNTYIWFDQGAWEVERSRSRYFSHAVATSHNVSSYYQKWNQAYSSEWITIIPNGIEVENIQIHDKQNARQQLGLKSEDFIFLNLASYSPAKNHIGLLAAFEQIAARYPRVKLICAGNPANQKYFQQVSNFRENLAHKERIELREFSKEIDLFLSAADVFVLNSIYEGWSLAATEAVLAGVPIIHSDCGSGRELVGANGERGILIPNPIAAPINLTPGLVDKMITQPEQANTQSLTDAMRKMIDRQAYWQSRKGEMRLYAADVFTQKNMLAAYSKLLKQYTLR